MSAINLEKVASAKQVGLLCAAFNQDYGCFAVGLENGFRVYTSDPLTEVHRRDLDGGIGHVEMLFRCNYLALVGGGSHPKYPSNKVVIWNELSKKCIIELEFRTDVKAVKLRRDRIVVVLKNKVIIHSFTNNPERLNNFETVDNENGVCALCSQSSNALLAFPGRKHGHIQLVDIGEGRKNSNIIQAHEGEIQCITLNLEGTRLASASAKGTLIRIFDTQSNDMLFEFRRGWDVSTILSISFNFDTTRIVVSSDKGTVHIFNLSDNNRRSKLAFLGDVVEYFGSEWSFARFHLPEPVNICAFSGGANKNVVIAICADGTAYRYSFDGVKGGDCKRESFHRFLKMTDED